MAPDWDSLLRDESAKPYWNELQRFVADERSRGTVYPPDGDVLAALKLTPYDEVKAVILGQDPYLGAGEAHGLCFSVREGITVEMQRRLTTATRATLTTRADQRSLVKARHAPK